MRAQDARLLVTPEDSGGKRDQRVQELEDRRHRDTDEPEGQTDEPDGRPQEQREDRDRPSDNEQYQPEEEREHDPSVSQCLGVINGVVPWLNPEMTEPREQWTSSSVERCAH